MGDKNRKPIKRVFGWFLLTIASMIVGSLLTFAQHRYIYPVWAKITSTITGKRCCFKARDPIPVETFAKQMTNLIKTGYIISVDPQATYAKIAPGVYECQKTYFDVAQYVLDRNSGNISYSVDHRKKFIHITLKSESRR